jgi:hypothetical protein
VGSCTAQLVRDSGGSHMTISRLCGRFLFVFSVLFLLSSSFLSSRVSAHVNVPALVGMKLMCLAPSGFGILSRPSRDLRDSQKELSRR